MSDDERLEEIIRLIASKHGIVVGRDDPLLVLQTMNLLLLKDNQAAMVSALGQFREEIEAVAHTWGEDAKGKAERIMNAALTASQDAMRKQMEACAASAVTDIRKVVDAGVARLASVERGARGLAAWILGTALAASVTTAGAAVIVWTYFTR